MKKKLCRQKQILFVIFQWFITILFLFPLPESLLRQWHHCKKLTNNHMDLLYKIDEQHWVSFPKISAPTDQLENQVFVQRSMVQNLLQDTKIDLTWKLERKSSKTKKTFRKPTTKIAYIFTAPKKVSTDPTLIHPDF